MPASPWLVGLVVLGRPGLCCCAPLQPRVSVRWGPPSPQMSISGDAKPMAGVPEGTSQVRLEVPSEKASWTLLEGSFLVAAAGCKCLLETTGRLLSRPSLVGQARPPSVSVIVALCEVSSSSPATGAGCQAKGVAKNLNGARVYSPGWGRGGAAG